MNANKIFDMLLRWKWYLVVLLLAVTAFTARGLKTALVPDNAITVWFLETDPLLKSYHQFHEIFGNDEVILMLLEDPEGVVRKPFLDKLETFVGKIESIDGVRQVHSVLSAQDAFDRPDGLEFSKIIPSPITDDTATLQILERRMLDNPLIRERLLSSDGRQAMIWIQMKVMSDIDFKRDSIIGSVRTVADESFGAGTHPMGGVGVIYSGLNLSTQHDFGIFLSISYLILFAVLMVLFRRISYVIAAMGVVSVGVIFTLGIYGLNGHQINMFTSILPTLIIVIAIADALHFPATFQRMENDNPGLTKREVALKTLPMIFIPCLLTVVTDTVGFLSLCTSSMAVMRHVGIYATLGLIMAFLASLVFMVAAFFVAKKKAIVHEIGEKEFPWIVAFLDKVIRQLVGHRRRWTVIAGILALIALGGMTQMVTDTFTIKYLPGNHPVTIDHNTIEKKWGPYSVLEYIVKPKEGTITNADLLNQMDQFVKKVEADPEVRNGFGVHQLYHRLAKVMGKELRADEKMTPDLVAQLKLVLDSHDFSWDKESSAYDDRI